MTLERSHEIETEKALPSRGVTVVVAVALGVVAAVASYSAVQSAPRKAFNHAKLVTVYVVNGSVPRQESVASAYSQGLISRALIPTQYVPSGAVRNLSAVGDRVAGTELVSGQVLVGGMLVSAADNPGQAADAVPAGDVAVSVSVDPAAAVGGAVQPGDHVDILVDSAGTQETYLFQSVPVLAVGTKLVPTPGTTPNVKAADVITFALPPAEAAHIPPTKSDGGPITQGVYLALESPGNTPTSVTTVNVSQLIPGASSSAAVPAGTGTSGPRSPTTTVPKGPQHYEPTP